MSDYQIGSKFADVFSDLGVLAMKPVRVLAEGVLGLVTVLTLREGKVPETTAEKIGAKAREWKSRIEASDRPTHLGTKIKVFFDSVGDKIGEKFAPARQVLIKEGPLTEGQTKLVETTREIDPFIAGFDSENRDIVRALYYQAKTSSDPDHHGKLMEGVAGLKIAGWKKEHLQELAKTLSTLLFSKEQADAKLIEALRNDRRVLASTPIKVSLLLKDIKDEKLHQTLQVHYYLAQQAVAKMGVEETVKGLKNAILALEGMPLEEKRVLSENLAAHLRSQNLSGVKEETEPEKPPGETRLRFAEKPEVFQDIKRSVPPFSTKVQQAFDDAAPFLSDLQKQRIAELTDRARQAFINGDEAELHKSLKFLRDHCLKARYKHAEQDPSLGKLYETILRELFPNPSEE
ncbi:MAG: hypothetical protein LLG04_10300 [Parachlamydia sp.]|nr:hypothetical protein [Parachlamydia sp.]